MCRLFGLHAGGVTDAEFWLLEAPDSLTAQSHRNPDGAGIGAFGPDGRPRVDKQPIAAWQDTEFARTARHLRGTTFVAHVRYTSTGAHTVANTHPFLQDGRLFARNGVVQGLDQLDRPAGGTGGGRPLTAASGRIRSRSEQLARQPSVVVATERMDDDPAWRLLQPGELLHVGPGLQLEFSTPFPAAPRHLLALNDLDAVAAASQHPA